MDRFALRDEPFAEGFLSAKTENITKRTALGILSYAKSGPLTVDGRLGLGYAFYDGLCCKHAYYGGAIFDQDEEEKKLKEHPELREKYRYLREAFRKYDTYELIELLHTDEEKAQKDTFACWGGTWVGHAVPDLIRVAQLGTDGLREYVRRCAPAHPEAAEFYEGLLIYLDAVDIMGERICALAKSEAEKASDPTERRKLLRLSKTFETCPRKPAVTFPDACAVYVLLFTNDGIDSPGHFDQYMIDFWRRTPYPEAREMLEDVWEFFHNTRTWNLCISGSDAEGNDLTNELSYEILDVTEKYRYQTPNLTMRCHPGTPEKLLRRAAQVIGTGCGMPTLYNDEAVCPALEGYGIPPRDSHEYVMNGCNQIDIQGKSHMGLEDGEVNLGKAVELVFRDGKCSLTGKQVGAHTGDPRRFETWEDFFAALRIQIRYLCLSAASMSNKGQRAAAERMSEPLRSLTIEGCVEKGLEYKCGGPLYGHGQILAEGVADCIDSAAMVKKYVYEEKRFSIGTLTEALERDFQGYEEIFDLLKRSELHFGNDIPFVDELGAEIMDDFNLFLRTIPTFRGGFFGGGCSPFNRAAENGRATGALPNGKKKGEPMYADSIGASPGKDKNGPTALLRSCLRFDQTLPSSGFILNVKFDKTIFNTEKGQDAFLALVRTYFSGRGQNLSVTVVSREELLDAKMHPCDHENLIVRVGGYSDYFINLSRELQDNVIARTELHPS